MKNYILISVVIPLLSCFASCKVKEAEISLSVSLPTEVPANGGTVTFTIETDGEWNVVSETGVVWYEITPLSGVDDATVSIVVEPNDTPAIRVGRITVTGSEQTKVVELTQAGSVLEVTEPDPVGVAGGTVYVNITANISWTVAENDTEWITIDSYSGEGDGVLTITVEPNTGKPRSADVYISVGNTTFSKRVVVSQNAAGLDEYLGNYEFTATALSYDSDRNEVRKTHTWTDVLKKASGGSLIQFSNMADMKNDEFAPFSACYADFKWNGANLGFFATRYAYPELFGYVNGGFIGCIHYESGPKKGTITIMEEFEITLNSVTGELQFPQEFTDPEDDTVWPASYVIFGWDNTGKMAGYISPYLSELTATKIN